MAADTLHSSVTNEVSVAFEYEIVSHFLLDHYLTIYDLEL